MSENKQTVSNYIEGFNTSDHPKILACLTDDVEWEIPGLFHAVGKQAFDQEIENDAFEGRPVVTIHRMAYEMPDKEVRNGDIIEWINKDRVPHTATSDAGGFDATLGPGETVRTPVARTGRFEVICKFHLGMRTVLVVH